MPRVRPEHRPSIRFWAPFFLASLLSSSSGLTRGSDAPSLSLGRKVPIRPLRSTGRACGLPAMTGLKAAFQILPSPITLFQCAFGDSPACIAEP